MSAANEQRALLAEALNMLYIERLTLSVHDKCLDFFPDPHRWYTRMIQVMGTL